MATWKKVLVSGSNIHVNEITGSSLTNNELIIAGTGGALESSGLTYDGSVLDLTSANIISGSLFSGSFVGDGAGLTGLVTVLRVTGSGGGSNVDDIDLLTDSLTVVGGTSPITTTITNNQIAINVQDASTTQKGLSQFDSGDFSVSSGNVTLADSATGAVIGIQGTTNEVDVSRTNGTVTVGLPDDVTITSTLNVGTDLYVGGDLAVNGDLTYINTSNLLVEDPFILLASGSVSGDSGIVFGGSTGVANSGSALFWDYSYNSNDGRLAVASDINWNNTGDQTPAYHIAAVFEGTEANAATAQADHVGNIRVENINGVDEIFIYA